MPEEPSQPPPSSQLPPSTTKPSLFQRGLSWLRSGRQGAQKAGGDVVIGEVGQRARNVIIGKNNLQINVAGRLLTFPIWLILIALVTVAALLAIPFVEPYYFPTQMTGDMKIAITDFGQMDKNGHISQSSLGAVLSQSVYSRLEDEYKEIYPQVAGKDAGSVEIWQDSMESNVKNFKLEWLTGATPEERAGQAKTLAQRINADVVIYGYLQDQGDDNSLHLDFYYAGKSLNGEPDTVSGRYVLGNPILIPIALEQDQIAVPKFVNQPLSLRAKVLFWVTTALVLDITDQHDVALKNLQDAQTTLTDLKDADGQALLQYFIGREALWLRDYDVATAAFNQAISLTPNYVNAYIGLGNVHYDRAQLRYASGPTPAVAAECVNTADVKKAAQSDEEAASEVDLSISLLQQALQLAPASAWPPIEFPARFALGQAMRLKGQIYALAGQYELANSWLSQALEQFDIAQKAFEQSDQQQYIVFSHVGRAAVYLTQAQISAQLIKADEDKATILAKRQAVAALLQKAIDECQRCIDEGKEVADQSFRTKVVDCNCQSLLAYNKNALAQIQKAIDGQ